jgi:hypothetical protein
LSNQEFKEIWVFSDLCKLSLMVLISREDSGKEADDTIIPREISAINHGKMKKMRNPVDQVTMHRSMNSL